MKIIRVLACAVCVIVGFVGCQSAPKEHVILTYMENSVKELLPSFLESAVSDPGLMSKGPLIMRQGQIRNETTSISNECVENFAERFSAELSKCRVARFVPSESGEQGGRMLAPTAAWKGKLVQKDSRVEDGRFRHELTLTISILDITTGEKLWQDERCIAIIHK